MVVRVADQPINNDGVARFVASSERVRPEHKRSTLAHFSSILVHSGASAVHTAAVDASDSSARNTIGFFADCEHLAQLLSEHDHPARRFLVSLIDEVVVAGENFETCAPVLRKYSLTAQTVTGSTKR
jgi:hypothetical protein